MSKPVIHFEIGCDNLPKTIEFYKNVFGWDIVTNNNLASINSNPENGIPGHITDLVSEVDNYITIYIQTETIVQDLKLIESKGGKVLVNPIELPNGRTFAWFQGVAGNTVGLLTPLNND